MINGHGTGSRRPKLYRVSFNIIPISVKKVNKILSRKQKLVFSIPEIIDQWELAKEDLAQQISTGISSNRNIIDIGNPSIDRFEIPESPPCLRNIFTRLEGFEDDGTPVCSAYWLFRCYSDDKELLTKTGWKLFKDLTFNDTVATLNNNNELEYNTPDKITSYDPPE